MRLSKHGNRNWAVYDNLGVLVCVTLYKKGAIEVIRRLEECMPNTQRLIRGKKLRLKDRNYYNAKKGDGLHAS